MRSRSRRASARRRGADRLGPPAAPNPARELGVAHRFFSSDLHVLDFLNIQFFNSHSGPAATPSVNNVVANEVCAEEGLGVRDDTTIVPFFVRIDEL